MIDINLGVAIVGAVGSAIVGLCSGVAVASWWMGTKNGEHVQLVADVKAIKEACPSQHADLMRQLKDAVCAGFKLAIKELGSDFDHKLADRDKRIADIDKTSAILTERMRQAEADIEAIFGLFNRSDVNHGRQDGDRRREHDGTFP